MAKGFKNKDNKFIPTGEKKGIASSSVNSGTEVTMMENPKEEKSLKSEPAPRIKDSLPKRDTREWNVLKDQTSTQFNRDFNQIRLDNLKKVDPNYYDKIITTEPSIRDLKDHFGELNLSDKQFEENHNEDEINDAKSELENEQMQIMWSTLFEAKDSDLAKKILENQDKIMNDIKLRIIDMSDSEDADAYETGVFLGVNGAGYDFYQDHWIPLYRLFGWV